MKDQERRRLTRYNLRTPLRFRALGVDADSFRKIGRYADAQSKFIL